MVSTGFNTSVCRLQRISAFPMENPLLLCAICALAIEIFIDFLGLPASKPLSHANAPGSREWKLWVATRSSLSVP